jgi:transposase
MIGIPEATAIILTTAERTELEGLARSTKTEHRLRQRARIVLLAAEGMASRAIGRAVGCTTGTASKWRVRYAEKRFGGLDETGDRGAEPKYTAETDKRILALLDQPKPKGYARWSGPLLAAALGDVDVQYVWRFLRGRRSTSPGANPGARAAIRSSPPRRPTWLGSTWPRRRTRSSSASMKSPRSRRWSGHRAI